MLKHEQGAAVLTFAPVLIIRFYWLQNMFKIKQQILSGTPLHLSYQCNRFDLICCFGVVPKEMKSKPCPVQKGNPGAEVTIFADLSLRFAPDNWGLFSTVNLCQFESNQLWSVQIVLSSGDGRPDLRDIFRACYRAKFEIMVDHGSSRIV